MRIQLVAKVACVMSSGQSDSCSWLWRMGGQLYQLSQLYCTRKEWLHCMQDQQLYFTSSHIYIGMLCNSPPTATKLGDTVKIDKVIITPDPRSAEGKKVLIEARATVCMTLRFYNYMHTNHCLCHIRCITFMCLVVPSAAEQSTGGKIEMEFKFGIIPVFVHTSDLCEMLKLVNATCPVVPVRQTFCRTHL